MVLKIAREDTEEIDSAVLMILVVLAALVVSEVLVPEAQEALVASAAVQVAAEVPEVNSN